MFITYPANISLIGDGPWIQGLHPIQLGRETMTNIILLNPEFSEGYCCAKKEVAAGDIFCVESALMGFALDKADSEFQRGYRLALLHERGERP